MTEILSKRLQQLAEHSSEVLLGGRRIGIEKECLRVTPEGTIAVTGHPAALGSALEHRFITTDYSEALLEFVTPPVHSPWEATQFLCDLHQFTVAAIGDEILWPMSMPCRIDADEDVPIAVYGSSNIGRMKNVYRRGLGHRYGRRMQAIAGIHFNFSPADAFWPLFAAAENNTVTIDEFRSSRYMGLVRNVRRIGWLLSYLFGASPAIAKPFPHDGETVLEEFDADTLFGPYATSLRMSDIGYQNSNQATISVSANSIDEYIENLSSAVQTPCADYERIGLTDGSEYLQLNTNILQIENEYYGTIRPKRVARSGEKPTNALRRGGVEYIELRSLDISPFDPVGINQQQIRFLEAFLFYCLLESSSPIDADENRINIANHSAVAAEGRRPGLTLISDGHERPMTEWAGEIGAGVLTVAQLMDGGADGPNVQAVEQQLRVIENPALTPSARLLEELNQTARSLLDYGLSLGRENVDYFRALDRGLNSHWDEFVRESAESFERQQAIEKSDELSFDDFVANYND